MTNDDEFYEAERIAAIAFGGEPPTRRSYEPDPNNVIYLAYADGKPVARASAAFGERGGDAVRRLDAAGGTRPRRVPRARRSPLGRCGRARNPDPRHAGGADVAADPRTARVPRGVRDSNPDRSVRNMRVSAKADYAIRAAVELAAAGDGPGQGRPHREGAEHPAELPREHPAPTCGMPGSSARGAGRRAATGLRVLPTRSRWPT